MSDRWLNNRVQRTTFRWRYKLLADAGVIETSAHMDIGCFLEKYQTLVVGLLGFSGVIFTLYANSTLNRKQHQREIEQEQRTLRQALLAELRIIHSILQDRSQSTSDSEYKDCLFPARIPDTVYKAFLPRIGILSGEEVSAVMRAYVLVAELAQRLRLLSPEANVDPGLEDFLYIEEQHVDTAIGIHKSFSEVTSEAIRVLEKYEAASL